MRRHCFLLLFLPAVWAVWSFDVPLARAAGRAELIVATEQGAPLAAPQDWARALGEAGVENVRIRGREPGDRPGIKVGGTEDRPTYVVTGVLDTVSERLRAPILLDHVALSRWNLDPDKVHATLPQKRTTYSVLLQSVLFQARLKSELRVDEAGKPFLWVTSLKPI